MIAFSMLDSISKPQVRLKKLNALQSRPNFFLKVKKFLFRYIELFKWKQQGNSYYFFWLVAQVNKKEIH